MRLQAAHELGARAHAATRALVSLATYFGKPRLWWGPPRVRNASGQRTALTIVSGSHCGELGAQALVFAAAVEPSSQCAGDESSLDPLLLLVRESER